VLQIIASWILALAIRCKVLGEAMQKNCAARTGGPCSTCCILPPHILTKIAERGNPRQRSRALQALSVTQSLHLARVGYDESVRELRQLRRAARQRLPRVSGLAALIAGQPQRKIYTASNTQRTPGRLIRSEGAPPTGDPAVDEAYEYMGDTYTLYWNVFNRDSIDDDGMPLHGTVHYDKDYDNAFWDGREMIYGDGDREQFDRFTKSVDVIGHELTHGVTQNEAGLIYWAETGALNESISDVFGSLVKQYRNNQTAAQADWLIGQGLFMPGVNGVAIRSMKAPGTAYNDPVLGRDPQPSHMSKYVRTLDDSGGVHINSGIPNHAFYLAATRLGGYAWENLGTIWYETLLHPLLKRTAKFSDFARLTMLTAHQLFPEGPEAQAVGDSWAQVGVTL
jgi:Zn-dependent metalloprotease